MGLVAGEAGRVAHIVGCVMQGRGLNVAGQRDDAKAQNHSEHNRQDTNA